MHSLCTVLAIFAVALLATVAKPLAPPTTGWLYNLDGKFGSFILPFTATQCEPFDIFYNNTVDGDVIDFYDAKYSHILFTINSIPKGIGYLEWICNIPAGIGFSAAFSLNYVVQPGSSSACLGNITTTYSRLTYSTTAFASYTQTASIPSLPTNTLTTTTFPTGAYSTITLNPNLAVTPTSSPNAEIAGGVVGAVAFVLLILAFMLWRRRRSSGLARTSSPINAQPTTTGELESTYLSPPFQSSGAELPGTTPAPCSHGNELKSDSGAMVVPVAGSLEPAVVPVALSPANSESATLSTQQTYDGSTITTSGGAVGSGNVNINNSVSNVFNIYNVHHPQPDLSSSLPHLPTSAAQISE